MLPNVQETTSLTTSLSRKTVLFHQNFSRNLKFKEALFVARMLMKMNCTFHQIPSCPVFFTNITAVTHLRNSLSYAHSVIWDIRGLRYGAHRHPLPDTGQPERWRKTTLVIKYLSTEWLWTLNGHTAARPRTRRPRPPFTYTSALPQSSSCQYWASWHGPG